MIIWKICAISPASFSQAQKHAFEFTKDTGQWVGSKANSLLEPFFFFFPAKPQFWEDLASMPDEQVQNLPLGCQEFQSLLPKQNGSQWNTSRGGRRTQLFFFLFCIESAANLIYKSTFFSVWLCSLLAQHLSMWTSLSQVWVSHKGC